MFPVSSLSLSLSFFLSLSLSIPPSHSSHLCPSLTTENVAVITGSFLPLSFFHIPSRASSHVYPLDCVFRSLSVFVPVCLLLLLLLLFSLSLMASFFFQAKDTTNGHTKHQLKLRVKHQSTIVLASSSSRISDLCEQVRASALHFDSSGWEGQTGASSPSASSFASSSQSPFSCHPLVPFCFLFFTCYSPGRWSLLVALEARVNLIIDRRRVRQQQQQGQWDGKDEAKMKQKVAKTLVTCSLLVTCSTYLYKCTCSLLLHHHYTVHS